MVDFNRFDPTSSILSALHTAKPDRAGVIPAHRRPFIGFEPTVHRFRAGFGCIGSDVHSVRSRLAPVPRTGLPHGQKSLRMAASQHLRIIKLEEYRREVHLGGGLLAQCFVHVHVGPQSHRTETKVRLEALGLILAYLVWMDVFCVFDCPV